MVDSIETLQARLPFLEGRARLESLNKLADLLHNRDFRLSLELANQAQVLALELGDESNLAESLLNIARAKLRLADYQASELNIKKALAKFQQLGNESGKAVSLITLGNINGLQGQLPKALEYFLQALPMLQTLELQPQKIKCLYNIGNVYGLLGDYATALEYYLQAHKFAQLTNDDTEIHNTSANIGDALHKLQRYNECLEYYQEALGGARRAGIKHIENIVLLNIGEVYILLDCYELALPFVEEGSLLSRELGDRYQEVRSLSLFAQLYNASGELELSRQSYEQGLELSRIVNTPQEEIELQLNFAQQLLKLEDWATAHGVLQQALKLAEDLSVQPEICRAHELLASAYKNLADFRQALKHYEQYHELNQKMLGQKQAMRIEASLIQQEIEKTRQITEAQRIHNEELQNINIELSAINRRNQRLIEQVQHQARHDVLTELPNRRLFEDRLQQTLFQAARSKQTFAVMLIDLDGFKFVNDTFGHDVGDELLVQVAALLKSKLRQSDTVGRLGGDEFSVIVNNLNESQGAAVVAYELLKSLQTEFEIWGHKIYIGASIGISLYPQDGEDIKILQKHADIAMYYVKRNGKNDIRFYSPDSYTAEK